MHPYLRLHVLVRPEGLRHLRRPAEGLRVLRPADALSPLTAPRLRRVIGKALVDTFCPFGAPRCQARGSRPAPADRCHLAEVCPYGVLYAGSLSRRPPFALYVLPGSGSGGDLVELSLYGPAWRMYPWMLAAIQRALRMGLGRDCRRWRVERVLKVCGSGRRRRLCGGDLAELPPDLQPEQLKLTAERYVAPEPMGIELLSPTRLIRDGRLLPRDQPVTFDLLVARIFDRFCGLYGERASELLRPSVRAEIEEAAGRVPVVRDETRWIEVKDYSARSRSELLLGGRTGRLLYGEPASRFLALMRAGEVLHVGKNPTSGCGRMRIRPHPA